MLQMVNEAKQEAGIRHFQRGLALEAVNRMPEAATEYRQAITYCPYLREAHAALGFYYQRNGLLAKAVEEFQVVASLEGDFLTFFNLGHLLAALDRHEEALLIFQTCLQQRPQDPATHYKVGTLHFARQEFAQALAHLQLALDCYPDDWEIHQLVGKCQLQLHHYDEALTTFGLALMLAPSPQAQTAALEQIITVKRYLEFPTLASDKERWYAQSGIVCLGSAQDNGLHVNVARDYHFTYPDIGVTLQRFLALQQSFAWRFTTLLVVDKLTQPLVMALSNLLRLPIRQVSELRERDNALLVLAVAREAEILPLANKQAPCQLTSFVLGLNWLRRSSFLPDLVGMVVQENCSVPWEAELRRLRADGASPSQLKACFTTATAQILQATCQTPPDPTLAQQTAYYAQVHRQLRFTIL